MADKRQRQVPGPHQVKGAVGKLPKGVEIPGPEGRYTYDYCCEDCGAAMGFITFDGLRPNRDPADTGAICSECAAARTAAGG